jgi:hypothetical protein
MNQVYLDSARLLTRVAPLVLVDDTFALKGGTAINLFVRDMPRLSVDLDLVFPDHTPPREEALRRINEAIRQSVAASLAATIAKVAWRPPAGVRVERILWSAGLGDQLIPVPPAGTDEVVVVSPFVDKSFLARQIPKGAKPARCVLLTTMREIERIGPMLAAFDDLLALEYPISDPEPDPQSSASGANVGSAEEEEEEVGRGLHAKLLFMRSGRKRTLWVGSANATMRAWTGRNAEVTAELLVSEPVEKGLKALLGSARLVEAPSMEHSPDAAALEEEALEWARTQVAARWEAVLSVGRGGVHAAHDRTRTGCGAHP